MSNETHDATLDEAIVRAYTALAGQFGADYGAGMGPNELLFGDLVAGEAEPGMKTALDVGCGAGQMAVLLARRIASVTGIDITPAMIDRARGNAAGVPGATFVVGDAQTYPFESRFDLITSLFSLEYTDRRAMLRRLRGMLNPGGKLVLVGSIEPDQPEGRAAIVTSIVRYFRYRRARGLHSNARAFVRNLPRLVRLHSHPGWRHCADIHGDYRITSRAWASLIHEELPTARLDEITPRFTMVVHREPR